MKSEFPVNVQQWIADVWVVVVVLCYLHSRALYLLHSLLAICANIVMCVFCVCECDCWPSVVVVKLLVRVAILLCELKCFATHSNKNICTHAHTHTYTLLQPTRSRASWTVWELPRSGVPLSWLATLALRIRSMGKQGLPDGALWGCVCAGGAENQSRRQGRAFGHILYLPSIQFGWQPVY